MKFLIILGVALLTLNSGVRSQTKANAQVSPKVTFIELGSVNCIPCKKMQPVMKAIEQTYRENVKVVFYDVWTPEQKPFAQKYGIRLIPTQVFLDSNGKEFFRHEGFFPEEEIVRILRERGVTPVKTGR
jgi:thioredoxin 1